LNVLIFGAGDMGKECESILREKGENIKIIGFVDNDLEKHKTKVLNKYTCYPPEKIVGFNCELIIIANMSADVRSCIFSQLVELGVPIERIVYYPIWATNISVSEFCAFYEKNMETWSHRKGRRIKTSEVVFQYNENILHEVKPEKSVIINVTYNAGKNAFSDIETEFIKCGLNTGNLVFAEAMKNQLLYDEEVSMHFSVVNGNVVAGVMPAANMIGVHGEKFINGCFGIIENAPFPITLAGIGAQSQKYDDTPTDVVSRISKICIMKLNAIASQCVSLGVRGEFTAECLELMGIKNYRVIGCPSVYHCFNDDYPPLKAPSLDNTLINITTGDLTETKILRMGMKINAKWIMQMQTEYPEILLSDTPPPIDENILLARFPELDIDNYELQRYIKENAKVFFSFNEWNTFLQSGQFTFSFGSRLHGNMMALKNGIPALWIVHDSRTRELAEVLCLPHIDRKTFECVTTPDELLKYCDYSDFYANYNKMRLNYIEYLEENGLRHKFNIIRDKVE
jgi:hypothetical protein